MVEIDEMADGLLHEGVTLGSKHEII